MSRSALMMWLLAAPCALRGESDRFQTPNNGPNLGVWRITNDPTVRHWANYHNTQCWSPDGRYICYTRYAARREGNRRREDNTVCIHDLWKDEMRLIGQGHSPRWANRHNWLFYVHEDPAAGPTYEKGAEVRRLDADTGVQMRVCYGIEQCGDSRVADLRSGDGWFFIDPLSIICFPKSIGDNSGIYDADPKGSPDGTKVCFVSWSFEDRTVRCCEPTETPPNCCLARSTSKRTATIFCAASNGSRLSRFAKAR